MNDRLAFLKTVLPFNMLPDDVLLSIITILQEVNYEKDTLIYQQEQSKMKGIDIILTGEYESFFYDSTDAKRAVELHHGGYCYGGISILLNRKRSLKTAVAKKGTKILFLPRKEFRQLCSAYAPFFQHFTTLFGIKMLNEDFAHFYKKHTTFEESYIASEQLYSRKIEGVNYKDIVSSSIHQPIYEAATQMAKNKVSCLFITDDKNKIVGFVTDITLRDRVIAMRRNGEDPISSVMDENIISISKNALVYEAVLMMFRTKIRYLLVEDEGNFIGFLSRNRLLSEQAQSPLVFIQSVKLASNTKELKSKWEKVPQIVAQLIGRGVHAEIINEVVTVIADTISLKVIEEVIEEIGDAPAKFVYIVLGSEGRKELTLKTDQDNAIIYEDKANEHREEVRAYFLKFASLVSDKLNNIGFVYCSGGFMASNPEWTHSLSHWKKNYKSWIDDALPESAIKFSTMFDCRAIYGEIAIIDELRIFVDEELQKPNERFFLYLAKNALQYEPPLTFFKNIKTYKVEEKEVFDIKKAMTPIVDLVRVYALQNRIFKKENTGERLKALRDLEVFNESQFNELMQSYYYLMGLRLKNQTKQIINDNRAPQNSIELNSLTKIEKATLKEIFKTIENFQLGIKFKFTGSL
ncbi:CBS domain-containing protein [Pedobacter sp. UYEF25]